jgi:hypothetical protein
LYSPYNGTITVTEPDSASRLLLDSSYTIKWSHTGFPGSSLNLRLYDDTVFVAKIIEGLMVAVHSYPWDPVSSSRGSGNKYRIKATSDFDSSIYGFSPYFTIASQYWGGFTISSPSDTSVWSGGTGYKIQWDTSGRPGLSVALQLYNDSVFVSAIASSSPDTGSFSWSIPLTATSGTKYRIKITSTGDASISAFSKKFTIKGIDPDSYEPDNSRDSASVLTLGTGQKHSITLNDTDWVRFTADSGFGYIIRDSGFASFQTAVPLFYAKENTYTSYNFTNGSGQLLWMWSCEKTGTYYARISSLTGGNTGGYSFKITLFDPSTLVSFLTPAAASTVAAGSSFAITWVPDPAMLGDNVYLYLYKGNNQVATAAPAAVPDNGSHTWAIPAGFVSGSDYRIKIANAGNRLFYGMSGFFTLTGMAADTFEYDDSRDSGSASLLSPGIAQQHSMPVADTDWIRFSPDSGATYLFQVKGSSSFQTTISLFHGTETGMSSLKNSDSSGSALWLWVCDKPAPWSGRVNAIASGGYGTYSFKMTRFDSLSSITFSNPTASSKWYSTVSYTIAWTSDTTIFGSSVSLRLVKAGVQSSALSVASLPNSGTYSWTVPSAITPGTNYRVRIANAQNSQLCGLSPQFSISDVMPDSFETDDARSQASTMTFGTAQQHTMTVADTDWVRFSADSGSVYFIRDTGASSFRTYAHLFYGTDVTAIASNYSSAAGTLSWAWPCVKTGTYYARITPYTTAATGAYSFTTTKFDTLSSITFTSPISTSAFTAGSSNTITWVPDTGFLGTSAYLYLYKANKLLLSIFPSYVSNSGTYSWSAPSGLVTGNDYRIKIANSSNSLLYGYSAAFTINGMAADSYEPDNSRGQASTLALGAAQQHSITYADTDWVQFPADSGSLYIIQDNGISSFNTYVYLYYGTDAAYTSQSSTTSGAMSWLWTCAKSGTYYTRITSTSPSIYGSYSFRVTLFDPSKSITFTNPTATTTWTAGATDTIRWVPDSTILGTSVYLYFFKGSQQILSLSTFSVANSGSYPLQVPAGLMTGSDYRIKIANYSNSQLAGFSPVFSISGIAADSYEPDNVRGQASALTLGTAQQHTLTYADSDWIQFSADSGSLFSIRIVQAQTNQTRVDLFYGSDASVTSSNYNTFTGTSSWIWKSLKSGTWYARVTPYLSIYGGPYSFLMTKFDSLNTVQFSNPAAAAVVVAGQPQTITWKPDSIFYSTWINIAITKGFVALPIYLYSGAHIDNTGTFSWTPPSGLPTGSDYRIRMIDYPYAALVSYSPAFTINGMTPDSYEPDNIRSQATALTLGTAHQHNLTYADSDWVRFAADSGASYIIQDIGASSFNTGIMLYYSTDVNYAAQNNTSSGGGSLTWNWFCPKSGTYYAWIYPYNAGSYGSYSFKATLLDTLTMITFTNPTSTTTWNGGSTYAISWVPDTAILGSTVSLYLTKGNRNIVSLSQSGIPDNGSFSYQVPSSIATGSDYRVRIVNNNASQVFAYSQAFSINGMTPDSYEPDNIRSQASTITMGIAQQHNLTYCDTDWVKFSADSGTLFNIRTAGSQVNTNRVEMFYGTDANYSATNYYGVGSQTWTWGSTKSGTWYARITPYSLSDAGPYTFTMSQFDSLNTVQFTNPTASTVLVPGQSCTITWKPDTIFYGGSMIDVHLSRGFVKLPTYIYSGAAVSNDGTLSWTVPSDLSTGSDYRIRIGEYPSEYIVAYGPAFTISGVTVAADSYEPDSSRALASSLTLGVSQQHTLTFLDTDWVKLSADAGAAYLIVGSASFRSYGQIFSENGTTYLDEIDAWSAGTFHHVWQCTQSGNYYIRFTAGFGGTAGSFAFKTTKFDTLTNVTFTNPTSSTVVSVNSPVSVSWLPDSATLGNYVYLYLCKGNQLIGARSLQQNSGAYTFTSPVPTTAGTDYRVELKASFDTLVVGYSSFFRVQ